MKKLLLAILLSLCVVSTSSAVTLFADDLENGFTLNDMYITTFQAGYAPVAMEIEGRDIHGDWHYASVETIAAPQFIELDWIEIEYLGFSADTQYAWASIDNLRINESTSGAAPVPKLATVVLSGVGLAGILVAAEVGIMLAVRGDTTPKT